MKKSILIIFLALATCLTSYGQATKRERNLIKDGNEYFNKKQYAKAEEKYTKALEYNPNSDIAKYNLGTTLLRQRSSKTDKTKEDSVMTKRITNLLNDAATSNNASNAIKAHSYYNLGKMAYDNGDYAGSVENFKKSLKLNNKDEQTRKNLRMAQKKLQEQKSSNNNNKNNNDKKQNQQKDQKQPPQNQPSAPKEQQQQTNNDQLLKAMQNEEKNTRDKVNRRKAQMNGQQQTSRPW